MKHDQTILIIDDNPANLSVLTEHIKLWGFDFMVARNGESGIRKAAQGEPDLILLDIYMPGMDGFEVCQKLKSNPSTEDIPVIFLTANTDWKDKIRGFQMGAVDYINKPFQSEEVLARISRHLDHSSLRKQLEIKNSQLATQNALLENEIIERQQAEAREKELETTNRQLQKSESLGRMAGGVAHLFNNYLYVVAGNLELALEELPYDSFVREYLVEALKATKRCSDVSGTMLTYLGQTNTKFESIDISNFCKKNIPQFQSSAPIGVLVESEFMDGEIVVNANDGQMLHLLKHLVNNAFESIGQNRGTIKLITKIVKASEITKFNIFPESYTLSSERYGCIEITDTGCGISQEDICKLFDPFFTTKLTGRGLGLAVVLGIVKSWSGMIGVNSKLNHGSSFMVFIPLSLNDTISETDKLNKAPELKLCSTVLLVEDHEMVRNMAKAMLTRIGIKAILATNGSEAVELFQNNRESINCIVTDLSMPGMDGWETLAEIRKIKPDIPAILTSGYDEASAMCRDESEKPQTFLHKPYTMNELKIALNEALNIAHLTRVQENNN